MSATHEPQAPASPPPETPRHSRWSRFSPSMGWRAFWSEIVIVVLGVVIALAANETVQDWNWRNKVVDAETRILSDTDSVFEWSAEQYTVQPCIHAQLDGLARRVMDSGEMLIAAPVYSDAISQVHSPYVLRVPTRPWQFSIWEALVADGTASHFSQARQRYFNDIQSQAAAARDFRVDLNRLIGRLAGLAYPTALDPSARLEFLVDLESLRRQSTWATINSMQFMRAIDTNGIPPKPQDVEASLNDSGTVQFCKEHGMPIADWREFREAEVNSAAPSPRKTP